MATIGENVRKSRTERGWSQAALARRAGCQQSTIDRIEQDRNDKPSRFMPRIALALGVPLGKLDPSFHSLAHDFQPAGANLLGEVDLPVYGTRHNAVTGETEMGIVAVAHTPRPAPLANVRNAYSFIVGSDQMSPEYEVGDTAFVNPNLPPRSNATCAFFHSDTDRTVVVARVIRSTSTHWFCREFNAKNTRKARDFQLSRKEWPVCHRLIGRLSAG